MKTTEETLQQWVENRIHFYGGFNPRGKEFWTRDELELVAGLFADDTLGAHLTVAQYSSIREGILTEDLSAIREGRTGGPEITAQYIAMFDSLEDLAAHLRSNGWLKEAPYTEPLDTGI